MLAYWKYAGASEIPTPEVGAQTPCLMLEEAATAHELNTHGNKWREIQVRAASTLSWLDVT